MAYLQHGLLAASRPPDELLRGYEPAAVALLGELPQGTPARLLAAMPPRTPPGAVLAYSQTDLGRAFGPDPESAVVRLLSLPATPRPPAACSALAAAALLAMGTAPDDRCPGVVPLAGRGPVHRAPPARPPSLPF